MKKLIFCLLFIGCSRVQTLNTERKMFGKNPNRILWIQLAGFSEEHMSLLKFASLEKDEKTFFESSDCIGKMWSYNLFNLRPNSNLSFMSQTLGIKNINLNCTDLDKNNLWSIFKADGTTVTVLENVVEQKYSFEQYKSCTVSKELNNFELFKMAKNDQRKEDAYFHFQEGLSSETSTSQTYYDKSCQKETCYSTVTNNLKFLAERKNFNSKELIIVRDNSYLQAIQAKNIEKAKEILSSYNAFLKWYNFEFRNSLVVITGAASVMLDFPAEGKDWENFYKNGKGIFFKNTSLLSPVFAKGARSENFCGNFDESEFLKRLTFKAPIKEFQWDNLSPFDE